VVDISKLNVNHCPACGPDVTLDLSQGQRVLEHLGAHILHDPKVERLVERCGLCLRPSPICEYYLKKGKGARASTKIDQGKSRGCTTKLNFSYGVAAESTSSSPCSNVPRCCPLCPKSSPAIWRYSFKSHFQNTHNNADLSKYAYLWELSNFEVTEMKKIWGKRFIVSVKRPKRSTLPPLVVSDAHRSRIPST